MTFKNPEVVELGMAEELIRDEFVAPNTENTIPERAKVCSAAYIADEE
jgi:hypothetical protein